MSKIVTILSIFLLINLFKANSKLCNACKESIDSVSKYILKNAFKFMDIVKGICLSFIDKTLCDKYADLYGGYLFNAVYSKYNDRNYICPYLFLCRFNYVDYDIELFIKDLYKDYDKNKIKKETKNDYNILVLNDLHIDLEYEQGTVENCTTFVGCCRKHSKPINTDNIIFAKKWGSYTCDLPIKTLEQALINIKEQGTKFDFIFLLGDYNTHPAFDHTKDNYTENSREIAKLFIKHFPEYKNRFFPVIGNHDTIDTDQLSFTNPQDVKQFAEEYKYFFENDDFKAKAYFAKYIEEHNLKIIGINSLAHYSYNSNLIINPYDPLQMLKFMIKELRESEKLDHDVIFISHVPMTTKESNKEWMKHFGFICSRFKRNIKYILSGHTHADELNIIKDIKTFEPIIPNFISPAFTSFIKINPSFRIYNIKNNNVNDYEQYQINLEQANAANLNKLEWDIIYKFKQEYNIDNTSLDNLHKLELDIQEDKEVRLKYYYNFFTRYYTKKEIIDLKKDQSHINAVDFLPKTYDIFVPEWKIRKSKA